MPCYALLKSKHSIQQGSSLQLPFKKCIFRLHELDNLSYTFKKLQLKVEFPRSKYAETK